MPTKLHLLSRYLRPQWPLLLLMLLLMSSVLGIQLGLPQLIRRFLDLATAGEGGDLLAQLALLYIGAAVLLQLLNVAARYVGQVVAWNATNALRLDLAAHCLQLEMAFHKSFRPGELIERIDGDVSAMTEFFARFFVDLLINGALMVGVLALLFAENGALGFGMSALALVAGGVPLWVQHLGVKHWVALREISSQYYGFVGEILTARVDLRAAGAVHYVRQRVHDLMRAWLPIRTKSGLAEGMVWASSLFGFALGYAFMLSLGLILWRREAITIGTLYLIFQYSELLRRPLDQIRMQLQGLQRAAASVIRVQQLLFRRPTIEDGPGAVLPAGPLAVEFQGVSFAYEPDEPVLQDLNLSVAPGETLGLLGRTGSGKSSIARLLLRFYDPTAGAILIGGVPCAAAHLHQLRSRVGLVTQDVQLFEASVRDNLTFFDQATPDARILQVLDDLGLTAWLSTLPHGLDTTLAPSGASLSAGEAQLLAMARIFLSDPGLVILDEASSRLDPATEHRIETALNRLLSGRTGIIIAHRLATVQRADNIVILERGQVIEKGARTALAATPTSFFYQLLQTDQEELLA